MPAVGVITFELRLDDAHSLKDKRHYVKSLKDRLRAKFNVAVAEIDHQDLWQRSEIGFAAIAASVGHVRDVLDGVERFVWSFPEVEVISIGRTWMDADE